MLKIGITGGIGSGKSTVCKIFETLKIPVYNADISAAKIINTNTELKKALISLFGEDIYTDLGILNRKKLAKIIFSDKEVLAKVNSLIHPAVRADYQEWLEENIEAKFTIKEAAILFESGAYKQVDKVITVFAPEELRIKRVMNREPITREEVLRRIKNQMTEKEKIKRSDFVIYNDEKQLLIPQVLRIVDFRLMTDDFIK